MSPWAVVLLLVAIPAGAVGWKVMRSATSAHEDLAGGVIAIFGGLRLTETAVIEGTGDRALRHSLTGLSARVEIRSARNGRVTVPRVLLLGILALAVKKERYDTEANLVIEGPGTRLERAMSLRRHPDGADVAREFAARLNHLGAHPASDDRTRSRPWSGLERFDVALLDPGARQVEVVRVVRQLVRGIGLIDAKELVTGTPSILLEQVPTPEAEAARERLEDAGATVELL
jgi:ribosomal protein L7/L12